MANVRWLRCLCQWRYLCSTYLIERVNDVDGRTLMRATNRTVVTSPSEPLMIAMPTSCISLLNGVATHGTAARATKALKRTDIGGKTGTTNDSHDAWFCGYAGNLVAITWMGYDTPKPLGSRETGGGLALPIWIDFMKTTLKDTPEYTRPMPETVVESHGELFYRDPVNDADFSDLMSSSENETTELVKDQIF